MKKLSQFFLQGLLIFVPFVVTVYVVYMVFTKIDGFFRLDIPGLGFAATILLITGIGFAASNFLTKNLVQLADTLFTKLPLVKMIYSSIKDLIGAFVGDKKSFDKPVLVTLAPESNLQAIGFMTQSNLDRIGIVDRAAVYLPQSFNFAGNLIVVPTDQITPIDADPGEVMALIVSGGVSLSKLKG
ncbi:MAG: DUF502 domain-containing protein [Proteobacteria bacterium]|nr:DUF502 domain-containing protein [Pseudomonadota bacterium]MBU1709526.1 DUF502 domain-containing protein [Pseudomonadota bacterium]